MKEKRQRSPYLYAVVMISFLDTFAQLPIMSPYAQELGADPLLIGLIIGMYSFSNMFSNVLAGSWIDRFGRKRIMLIGMIIAGSSLILYIFVSSGLGLMWTRFVHGIGGGLLIPAVFAYLGDRTEQNQKGRTMAHSGAAIGIAAIVGPAFGGITKVWLGIEWVFILIALLLLGTAIFVYFFLPEEYTRPRRKQNFNVDELIYLLRHPQLMFAYLASFSMMFALGILTYMLPLKVDMLGLNTAITGILLSSYGIMAIIIFILPINRLSDRIGRFKPILAGLTIISCSLLWLSISSSIWMLLVGMLVYGMGFALLFPAMTALVIDYTREEERGKAFGLFYAFFSLGVVIGPIVVGWLNYSPDISIMLGSLCIFLITLYLLYSNWNLFRAKRS